MSVDESFKKIITSEVNINKENYDLNLDFMDIGIDSISFIKIVVALENEFAFEFDDEMLSLSSFENLNDMLEYVKSKVELPLGQPIVS